MHNNIFCEHTGFEFVYSLYDRSLSFFFSS